MAELDTSSGGGKHKGGKVRGKKLSTRIDMTPMVDLGFLLVTFFMLATSFSKPTAMEVKMPKDDDNKENETKTAESKTLTIILGTGNNVFYYQGLKDPQVFKTNYDQTRGIAKVITEKAVEIRENFVPTVKDQNMTVLIKPMRDSNYQNVVDMLDLMDILKVTKFAIVDITPADIGYIEKAGF